MQILDYVLDFGRLALGFYAVYCLYNFGLRLVKLKEVI